MLTHVGMMRRLRRFGSEVNDLTHGSTNMGGCCVVAAIVGDKLKCLGFEVKGVVASYMVTDVDQRRPANNTDVRAWNDNGVFFTHVGLEIIMNDRPRLYDSESLKVRTKSGSGAYLGGGEWEVLPGYLTVDELNALAKLDVHEYVPEWNCSFNRARIPQIQALADRMFPRA